jgi:hypothetical protein
VAGGDAQYQRHPNEEHRIIRLSLAPHLPVPLSLSPCVSNGYGSD